MGQEVNRNSRENHPVIDGIHVGTDYVIFKDQDNNIYGYGSNQYGQLGRSNIENNKYQSNTKHDHDEHDPSLFDINNYR